MILPVYIGSMYEYMKVSATGPAIFVVRRFTRTVSQSKATLKNLLMFVVVSP
jgi:hypothetical protein